MAYKNLTTNITDSDKDKEKLKQEVTIIDMPDVEDIPGQENITVPQFKEMADTTISSDDEEGIGLFNDANNADASNERIGSAQEISEDDLIIDEDEDDDAGEDDDDDDLNITDDSIDSESEVTEDEINGLERSEEIDSLDNEDLYASELDDTDFDGEKLNEGIDVSGSDLDIPGAEDDDENEDIGEEDEENNSYSLGDNE